MKISRQPLLGVDEAYVLPSVQGGGPCAAWWRVRQLTVAEIDRATHHRLQRSPALKKGGLDIIYQPTATVPSYYSL